MINLELPDEVKLAMSETGGASDDDTKLSALATKICELRDEAVRYRAESGIEQVWLEAEEAYLGIDDENRHEYQGSTWQKANSPQGPITRANSSNGVKSTAFVKITSRYVDAGAAKVGEILLPIDGKAFSFSASPVPELINMQDDDGQVIVNGQPAMRDPTPQEAPPAQPNPDGSPPAAPAPVPLTHADLAQEAIAAANKKATAAENRIYDWMVESSYSAETRKAIHDRARLGVGVIKGPFPDEIKKHATTKDEQGNSTYQMHTEINPSVKWVDPWNFYPDDSCGENIHDGEFIFEKDMLSPRRVKELKKNKVYLADQIDKVLAEGPQRINDLNEKEQNLEKRKIKDSRYEVWYYYGMISRDEMIAAKGKGMKDAKKDDKTDEVYAIVTIINNKVVRATINLLDSGRFPYHAAPWVRRINSWAGVGVAEQIRMPQRMTNAAVRALLVNAAKSAGAQIVVDKSCIEPADGSWTLTPDKLWFKTQSAANDDVNKAFNVFEFPNVQKEMMGIIEYGAKLAEDSCSIPLISQGQSGKTTPDTYGGQVLQDNNANQLLRSVGYNQDDYMTKNLVSMYYEWLLLDPKVPNDEKGDWNINAQGSAALIERYIQNTTINNILQSSLNPAFGADPYDTYAEYLRSQRLDPVKFQIAREEYDKAKEQQAPPPAPSVQVAQIRAQAMTSIAQGHDQVKEAMIKRDTDRDTVFVNAETQRTQAEHDVRMQELQVKERIAMLEYSNREKISLSTLKVQLANSSRDDQTKRELAAAEIQLAAQTTMYERTHDKLKHEAELRVNSVQPKSLTRDEVSTNITP